ncbi:nuclease [Brettanomyces nanus]|uniref:Endonuclease n=1 Tax=Eeniella nana TaxID=13502 RepID=A0A875RTJ7_EENNA|nr:nuclease [Brettanomyces nanus]QPG73567.1 nuclease [Brettanomyces nanus]
MFKQAAGATAISLGAFSFFWFGRSSSTKSPTQPAPSPIGTPGGPGKVPSKPLENTTPATQSSNINPTDFFSYYGFPGPIHDLEKHQEYVSVYDRRTRNPYYVVEHLTPESLRKGPTNGNRKGSFFKEDESIPDNFRALLRDYFRSGYDRGHQAPAADAKLSQAAMNETFLLTNMSPQIGEGFNRDYWASLEYFCRCLTQQYRSVRIITGPLFLPKRDPVDGKFKITYEVIGNPPNVAVPTHFFKLIIGEKSFKRDSESKEVAVAAFVLPNSRIPNEVPLSSFQVPIDALERSSGLELLKRLPDSNKKNLCKEVHCEIIVRDFTNSVKALPAPKK